MTTWLNVLSSNRAPSDRAIFSKPSVSPAELAAKILAGIPQLNSGFNPSKSSPPFRVKKAGLLLPLSIPFPRDRHLLGPAMEIDREVWASQNSRLAYAQAQMAAVRLRSRAMVFITWRPSKPSSSRIARGFADLRLQRFKLHHRNAAALRVRVSPEEACPSSTRPAQTPST